MKQSVSHIGNAWLSRKRTVGIVLGAILLLGFSLRFVHLDEWLYFKMDQARDAMLVSQAIERGPEYLPLLGPRVGAVDLEEGLLRTGPVYYYFQYLSGVIFGSSEPSVFAYPDMLFGVFGIAMLFLFARLFLSAPAALAVSALLSVSFLGVEYSRFAWNPNPLPFFLLLSFYGMLRFFNEPAGKKKYFFLALWALGFGIGAQLHFFGMMSLVGATGLFLVWRFELWKRENIRKVFARPARVSIAKYAGVAGVIFLVLSAPIIANDMLREGENTRNFFEAMTKKQDAKPLSERIGKAWEENGRYWCLITTAECVTESEKKNRIPLALTAVFLMAGFFVVILRLRAFQEGIKRDFLRLLFVWTGVFVVLSVPVAFQLRPRFFLVVLPIPFLLFGIVFEYMREKWARAGYVAGAILFIGIFSLNVNGIIEWFGEQAASQKNNAPVSRTIILKSKDGVTLGQLERAAEYMSSRTAKGERVYFYVKPEHIAPLEYLFEQKQKSDSGFAFRNMQTVPTDPLARFFAVVPSEQTELQSFLDKFDQSFTLLDFHVVGQIAVAEVSFANRTIDQEFRFENTMKPDGDVWISAEKRKGDRMFWGDVFFDE